MIECIVHSECTRFLEFFSKQDTDDFIEAMRKEALTLIKEGANHVVYAVKTYDEEEETGALKQIHIYSPPVPFDSDKEFYGRMDAEYIKHPGCYIMALHKHT